MNFTGTGTVAAPEFAPVTLNAPFYLPQGDYGIALYQIDQNGGQMQIAYTNGPANAPYGNGDVTVHPAGVGCSSTSELGPCAFSPRLWTGTLFYERCSVSSTAAAGVFAGGCANSIAEVPSMTVTSLPQIGTNFDVELDAKLGAQAAMVVCLGTSKDLFNGLPLPLDLGAVGAPGCNLAVSVDSTVLVLANPGANTWGWAMPNDPSLVCFAFYQQAAVLDIAANSFGFVLTNGVAASVGN